MQGGRKTGTEGAGREGVYTVQGGRVQGGRVQDTGREDGGKEVQGVGREGKGCMEGGREGAEWEGVGCEEDITKLKVSHRSDILCKKTS